MSNLVNPPDVSHILPLPFEWCEIPAGWVTIEDASDISDEIWDCPPGTVGGKFYVERFWMARYPITNAQYRVFVNHEAGYINPKWWDYSEEARMWRSENPGIEYVHPQNDILPITNVCWYEAVAFCRWLNAQILPSPTPAPLHGEGEKDVGFMITLPTEQQWQRAAQGDDGRKYPWGNEGPDEINLRNFDWVMEQSTLQPRYLDQGASPYGVLIMSGNNCEWCLTEWSTDQTGLNGAGFRVIRGGGFAGCAYRNTYFPNRRAASIGFRMMASVSG